MIYLIYLNLMMFHDQFDEIFDDKFDDIFEFDDVS